MEKGNQISYKASPFYKFLLNSAPISRAEKASGNIKYALLSMKMATSKTSVVAFLVTAFIIQSATAGIVNYDIEPYAEGYYFLLIVYLW